MKNMLLEPVEYKIEQTAMGTWRSFLSPNGLFYREFTSHMAILGLPLLQYTCGICPETGRPKTATGVIAVGRFARGILAIGQRASGLIAIGQMAIGLLFGLGQLSTGVIAIGQLAAGICFGLGQLATGYTVIAQIGLGYYVLAQGGLGAHVWSMKEASPQAQEFFRSLLPWLHQAEAPN